MTNTNPASMIASTRETGAFAALDYLPRIDYATGIVLAGAIVIGAVLAARRMTRSILIIDKPTKSTRPAVSDNALKDAMAAALEDAAIKRVQRLAVHEAHAVITRAKSIDGMEVHYVETPSGYAETMPAAFDAKRGAL